MRRRAGIIESATSATQGRHASGWLDARAGAATAFLQRTGQVTARGLQRRRQAEDHSRD